MKSFKYLLIALLMLPAMVMFGQSVKSPYSVIGIGDLNFDGLIQNQGMGEIGVGFSSRRGINLQNPAWLYRNTLSTFQVAMEGEYRTFATNDAQEGSSAAGLRYIAFAFPVVRNRWSTSFGALPYSTVNYNLLNNETEEESQIDYNVQYVGSGGLSQIYWSNSFRIYKNFALGINARYVFGNINNENIISINDEDLRSNYTSAFIDNYSFSDFNFTAGFSYRKFFAEKYIVNVGATYDISSSISGDQQELLQRRDIFNRVLRTDTLVYRDSSQTSFDLPTWN